MKKTKAKELPVEDMLILYGHDEDAKWVNAPVRAEGTGAELRRRKDGTYYLLRLLYAVNENGKVGRDLIGHAKMDISPPQAVRWWLDCFMPQEIRVAMQEMFNPPT